MLTRLNFLFSVSVLVLLAFGFAGRFVLFRSISVIAPGLTPYFIAAYVLATLMLTSLILAKLAIRLGPTASAARSRVLAMTSYSSQVLLCLAHVCVFFAIRTLVVPESGMNLWWPWLASPALYFGGIALFISDLRRRALPSSN